MYQLFSTDSNLLQKSQAVQTLVGAIDAAHSGVTAAAVLQQKMAHLCIKEGLQRAANGFQLAPIPMYKFDVDAAFKSAKAASRFASTKFSKLVDSTDMNSFSIVKPKYPASACVAVDITQLLPNPGPEVRSLLPAVWPASADSATSDSSSSDFTSSSSSESASACLQSQAANPHVDPVYSMLALLPSDISSAVQQQLGLAGNGAVTG